MSKTYTISELAEEFGVTTRTLRHYEDQGLVTPTRDGINRIYSHRDRVRLKLALRRSCSTKSTFSRPNANACWPIPIPPNCHWHSASKIITFTLTKYK